MSQTCGILDPQVGRRYLVYSGEYKFEAIVTAWDLETVTVKPNIDYRVARRWPEFLRLKRLQARFVSLS